MLVAAVTIEWWKALILGVVQGLTEFLPISSSAHLALVPWLFGWQDPGLTFDVALHIGTLVAVLIYFWRDLLQIATALIGGVLRGKPLAEPEGRLGVLILLGSIPAIVAGVLLDAKIEEYFHPQDATKGGLVIIACALMGMGLLLAIAERVAGHVRSVDSLQFSDAAIIGVAQTFALIPGVSRSGSTITAGLFVGLRRDAAARFSFLLSLPVTAGAALKKVYDLIEGGGLASGERLSFAIGILTAGLVGFACIAFLLRFLQRSSTLVFTIYRVALGLLILLLVAVR